MNFSIHKSLRNTATVNLLRRYNVIYLDRGIIIINKPSGLVSQGTHVKTKKEGTMQIAIDDIRNALGLKEGPFPIHRLDKPTTGTFVLATTAAQAKAFSRAFMHKESSEGHQSTVIKRYIALVYTGSPETNLDMLKDPRHNSAETSPSSKPHIPIETVAIQSKLNRMKLDLYIGAGGRVSLWRDVSATLNPVDFDREISRRKVAISEFNILGLSAQYPIALVGMRLYTGIKHQLRVTLASHLKAPILGDDLHGGSPEDSAKILPGLVPANKLMLHASSVSLQRFKSKKPFCFHICAAPPQEFLDVCQKAGIDVPPPLRNGGVWYDAENVTDSLRWETVCQTNIADDTVGVFALEGAWLS